MSTVLGNMLTFGGGGSGGSNGIFAAIAVSYPSGSTCTATNGTTTLTAADTSGQVVFGIPEPASTPETWTVSCSSGSNSASTNVSISSSGQIENVTLSYTLLFYFEGNEHYADPGMTWQQWINSGYNTSTEFLISGNFIYKRSNDMYRVASATTYYSVNPSDVIIEGERYFWNK